MAFTGNAVAGHLVTSVILDADVLHRANVRDVLLRVAREGLFQPHWSSDILMEVRRSLERRGLTTDRTRRLSDALTAAFPHADVSGYNGLIETLTLPDTADRHVLAAAIHGNCGQIVTYNLRDFPDRILDEFGVEAVHPDDFLLHQIDVNRAAVGTAMRKLIADLRNPPLSFDEIVVGLRTQSLRQFADALQSLRTEIET